MAGGEFTFLEAEHSLALKKIPASIYLGRYKYLDVQTTFQKKYENCTYYT